MPTVLGLDTSTRVGWCIFHEDDLPLCGTERLPKVHDPDDYGTRGAHLFRWLNGHLDKWSPDLIVFESPFIPMNLVNQKDTHKPGSAPTFNSTAQTIRLQIFLAGVIELVARLRGIECVEVATSTAKKALTGRGRAPNREELRELGMKEWDWGLEMLTAATARGWRVADDHQADACAVAMVEMMGRDIWRLGDDGEG